MILQGDSTQPWPFRDNSIDAIVTDPPYGLEFMGKEWDRLVDKRDPAKNNLPIDIGSKGRTTNPYISSRVTYSAGLTAQQWHIAWLTEAIRVLKPGGSLLAMGGSRTSHRLACAMEDCGFTIKDTLMWLYGSG